MQKLRFGAGFAMFVLGCAGQAVPDAPKPAVTVFIDPATRKIRQPKPAEVEALTDAAPAASQRPDDVHLLYGAHGAVGVKLGPESLNYVVFTKTSDGKVSTQCVTGADAAAKVGAGDASK